MSDKAHDLYLAAIAEFNTTNSWDFFSRRADIIRDSAQNIMVIAKVIGSAELMGEAANLLQVAGDLMTGSLLVRSASIE